MPYCKPSRTFPQYEFCQSPTSQNIEPSPPSSTLWPWPDLIRPGHRSFFGACGRQCYERRPEQLSTRLSDRRQIRGHRTGQGVRPGSTCLSTYPWQRPYHSPHSRHNVHHLLVLVTASQTSSTLLRLCRLMVFFFFFALFPQAGCFMHHDSSIGIKKFALIGSE